PNDPDVVRALINLSGPMADLDGFAEALNVLHRAVAAVEAAPQPDSSLLAEAYGRLGAAAGLSGLEDNAVYFEKALAIREAVSPYDSVVVRGDVANLGLLYLGQGRLAEARTALRRALLMAELALPPGHR